MSPAVTVSRLASIIPATMMEGLSSRGWAMAFAPKATTTKAIERKRPIRVIFAESSNLAEWYESRLPYGLSKVF
jgi:hypothetical protein